MPEKKRYIFLFSIIFLVLLMFVFLFFYFNIYILIGMLALILILTAVYFSNKGKYGDSVEENTYYDDEAEIEDKIIDYNEEFMLDHFYNYVKEVLHLVGNSYSKNNINVLNGFVGNDLIKKISKNIEKYNSDGNTRVISGINVRDLKLVDFYTSFGYQYIELHASISKIDCSVQNGVVTSGEKTNGLYQDYKLVFCKKGNGYNPNMVDKCPGCGSTSDKFSSGKCLNCGNIVVNMDGFYLIKMDEE